jgi:hypothetical protein
MSGQRVQQAGAGTPTQHAAAAAAPAGPDAAGTTAAQPRPHHHHSHPGDTLEDQHAVRLSRDSVVLVAEDEPKAHAVEERISDIEVGPDAGHPVREYLDKWRGGIDTRVPVPSVWGMVVSWVGAFVGILVG